MAKTKVKRKKKLKNSAHADADQKLFLKSYKKWCSIDESSPCLSLIKSFLQGIEDNKHVTKFIILEKTGIETCVSVEPVIRAIRDSFYEFIKELVVWDIEMPLRILAALAALFENRSYKISSLELMNCDIQSYSLDKLSQSFKFSVLTHINLDYNEFGDKGCELLCNGCKNNKTILSLSLCFCNLSSTSGKHLASAVNTSLIRELYLDGNKLECEGVILLLTVITDNAEVEQKKILENNRLKEMILTEGALEATDKMLSTQINATSSQSDVKEDEGPIKTKIKKRKKKSKKKKKEPPCIGPYIDILHLSDNGIDLYNNGKQDDLYSCISILQRLIVYSKCLKELDISRNRINETSANELLLGLQQRKIDKLPSLKMSVTTEISKEVFKGIESLAGKIVKKKKRGKKRKRKK